MSNDSGLGCANKVCWSILKTTIDITYALSEHEYKLKVNPILLLAIALL